MKDRYESGDDSETPEQTHPTPMGGKFKTIFQDDNDNNFEVEIDYSYTEFWGDVSDFEATVKPIAPYTMTVESMKESAVAAIYDEIGHNVDMKDIIILTPQSNG